MKKIRLFLAMIVIGALFFTACDEEEYLSDRVAPAPPKNLRVLNGDGKIEISWEPNTERDLSGYNVYYANDYWGKYNFIGSTASNYFIDSEAGNGSKYYYGIAAYDLSGNESELSYDEVYGIARPEGFNSIVFDAAKYPDISGWSFIKEQAVKFSDIDTDFFFEMFNGKPYINVWEEFDIQDMGYTDDIYDITEAPADGWIPIVPGENIKYSEAIRGHTYIIWTVDNHFAKIRISGMTAERIVFDWAFQTVIGERMLKVKRSDRVAHDKIIRSGLHKTQ